ncbi:hypothetical protein C8R47DRAFT_1065792 [Mycena vitilis]|nr:hypothetical protein C8R47DRAFT_1065792 [Mycena vitilis]
MNSVGEEAEGIQKKGIRLKVAPMRPLLHPLPLFLRMDLSHWTPSSDSDDLNLDEYFDFDAASCDPKTTATSWETPQPAQTASKAELSMDFDPSFLESLVQAVFHRDDQCQVQADVDVDGMESGFSPNDQYSWDNLVTYTEASDSDSCSSDPGSPSSFLSILSSPSSPISLTADDDVRFVDDDDCITSLPNTSPYTADGLETSTYHQEDVSSLPSLDSPSHVPTFIHAPRPVSSMPEIVWTLESLVQPPPADLGYFQSEDPKSACFNPAPVQQLQVIPLEDAPPPSPSPCEDSGPVHRVGKPKRKGGFTGRKKVSCYCGQTFTRRPDLPRHIKLKHTRPSPVKIFGNTGKDRMWCMGCLTILSRADSRRRHELHCPQMKYFKRYGVRDATIPPLLEIFSETNDNHRLWCSKCYETFANPTERYAHEGHCDPPPFDADAELKTYFPRVAHTRCP